MLYLPVTSQLTALVAFVVAAFVGFHNAGVVALIALACTLFVLEALEAK